MPSITISPCAMLMMRMTPKTIVRPTAIIAYSEPVSTPLTMVWSRVATRYARKHSPRSPRRRGAGNAREGLELYAGIGKDVGDLGIGFGIDIEKLASPPLRKHRVVPRVDVLIRVRIAQRTRPVAELGLAERSLHVGREQRLANRLAVGLEV